MRGNVYYQACWEQAANTFYLHQSWWWGGCWQPVGCVSLLEPSPWVTSEGLWCSQAAALGYDRFHTASNCFCASSLQTHLVSGTQVPLEKLLYLTWHEQPTAEPAVVTGIWSWPEFLCVVSLLVGKQNMDVFVKNLGCFCEMTNFSSRTKDYNASSGCEVFPSWPWSAARGIH